MVNGTDKGKGKENENEQPVPDKPFSWLDPHVQFVVIYVGQEEVPFGIQMNFICSRSTFFRDRFKGSETPDSLEHIVKLPDTTPEIFGRVQNFLFTGEVVPEPDTTPSYEVLIGVWKLGHMLGIDGLCDKALNTMIECRRTTQRIPATPLLIQVWKDTPEGSSIRQLLLSWAAEYMRASDARAEFARSLPQEVLSELVVIMSSLESAPPVQVASPAASTEANGASPPLRKSVHYIEESDEDGRRGTKRLRRVSGAAGASSMSAPPTTERRSPAVRRAAKPMPKRRSGAGFAMTEDEITTDHRLEFCSNLLTKMLSGPGFWTRLVGPFRDAVDPEKDQVPDYFTKVKNPMDLMSIKAKMDRGEYKTELEFAADVRLIFLNCYTYWKEGDPMWTACEKFQKTFEDKFSMMSRSILRLMRDRAERAERGEPVD
ncbi:hypothetical protein ACRALDRAFT_1056576 [Sodiomyces alcalophilus JCM 7366]|uniref:uncharacterized protein n=1 Tax=Sodiomyces alcalophilus JCM 7366 TaxID=591952 RepID=UPI0039B54A0D